MLFGNREGKLIIAKDVFWVEALEVDELWAKVVDDGAEAEPAPPAGGHVEDVDALVALRHPLAPSLEGFRALHCHLGVAAIQWSGEVQGDGRKKGLNKKELVKVAGVT